MSDTSGSFDLNSMLAESVAARQSPDVQNATAFPATPVGGKGPAAPAPAPVVVPDDNVTTNIAI